MFASALFLLFLVYWLRNEVASSKHTIFTHSWDAHEYDMVSCHSVFALVGDTRIALKGSLLSELRPFCPYIQWAEWCGGEGLVVVLLAGLSQ